jgi:hypothetical protein
MFSFITKNKNKLTAELITMVCIMVRVRTPWTFSLYLINCYLMYSAKPIRCYESYVSDCSFYYVIYRTGKLVACYTVKNTEQWTTCLPVYRIGFNADPNHMFWWREIFLKSYFLNQKLQFICPHSLGFYEGRLSYRKSLQPSKKNIEYFKLEIS